MWDYARKCKLRVIEQKDANVFLKRYHLQNGAKMQRVCLGLFYEGDLVEVMTFGPPRFNKNFEWELIRLCTKTGIRVLGGSQKLWKHFVEEYNYPIKGLESAKDPNLADTIIKVYNKSDLIDEKDSDFLYISALNGDINILKDKV